MNAFLESLINKQSVIADFYRENLSSEPITGKLIKNSNSFLIIDEYGGSFRYFGTSIINRADLTLIEVLSINELPNPNISDDTKNRNIDAINIDHEMHELLYSVIQANIPVSIYRELVDPNIYYIANDMVLYPDYIVGTHYDKNGRKKGAFCMRTEDITQITLFGVYESYLVEYGSKL